jgi:hypothetical protein
MEITEEVKSKLHKLFRAKLNEICNRVLYNHDVRGGAVWPFDAERTDVCVEIWPFDAERTGVYVENIWNEYLEKQGIVLGYWSYRTAVNQPASVIIRDPLYSSHRWIAIDQELAMKIMVLGEVP